MNAPHHPVRETDPAAIDAALQAAMASTAIADVHARRLEQITKHGHTPAIDALQPLSVMVRKLGQYAGLAMDHCGYGDHVAADRLAYARKHLVTSAALAIAVIDRIDIELAQMHAGEGAEG